MSIVKNDETIESFKYEKLNPKPIEHKQQLQITQYEYDNAFNLIKVTKPNESVYEYEYSKEGFMLLSRDALNHETLYEYNPQAMLTQRIDPLNNVTKVAYDKLSRVTKVTLANDEEHQYRYNQKNQIIAYQNPNREALLFSYSKSGKLLGIKDPAKRVTEFSYDEYDRVISKTYPYMEEREKQTEYYAYNPDNTLSSITRVDGTRLYLNYDANQNIIKILADDNQGSVESLEYGYDTLSQLIKAVSPENRVELEYNRDLQLNYQNQNGMKVQTLYDEKHKQLDSLIFLDHTVQYAYAENYGKILKTPKLWDL